MIFGVKLSWCDVEFCVDGFKVVVECVRVLFEGFYECVCWFLFVEIL